MNSTAELDATYFGFIESTYDALILFEACIAGHIKHVSRRPHDREREQVIQSGRVFIYEESSSGIKRWTDGISWSPSRILGNFLIYRQLVKAFGPGEKKKAIKKSKAGPVGITKSSQVNGNGRHKESLFHSVCGLPAAGGTYGRAGTINADTERALIGSLTDSYDFLEDGLVKKTISVTCGDVTHHLVSYYTIADAIGQKFLTPSKDPRFMHTHPRPSLLTSQNFRSPVEDIGPMDNAIYPRNKYDMTNQSLVHHSVPIVATSESHAYNSAASNVYHENYAMTVTSASYENTLPAYPSGAGYPVHYAPIPSIFPGPQRLDQYHGDYRQRFVANSRPNLDGSRAQMPTASSLHREAPIFHRRDSGDSGVSMSMEKMANDSTYHPIHNSFYGFPRDITITPNNMTLHPKALPSILRPDFPRHDSAASQGPNCRISMTAESKDMWQTGNISAGHGHYQHA